MSIPRIIVVAVLLLVSILATTSGCSKDNPGGTGGSEPKGGSVTLTLKSVPSDVRCLQVTVAGNQRVVRTFDTTPGQPATFTASGLPIGNATIYEEAFDAACASLGPSTTATWVAVAPVAIVLQSGQAASLTIVLRRPAGWQGTSDIQRGPLAIAPSRHAFEPIGVGASTPAFEFTLTNTSAVPVAVPALISGPDQAQFRIGTNTCSGTLGGTASCTVGIVFAPQTAGGKNATLNVGTASASLSGIAASAILSIAPPSYSFGNVTVGQTSTSAVFTVTNTSQSSVSLTSPSVTGIDAGQFRVGTSTCGATLDPSAACTVALTFAPISVGAKAATFGVGEAAAAVTGMAMDARFPGYESPPLDELVQAAVAKGPPAASGADPYATPAPVDVPPLARPDTDGLPKDDAGKPILGEMLGVRIRLNSEKRDPITAMGACLSLGSSCALRPNALGVRRSIDACWASVPRCSTNQPWIEGPCCPVRCAELHERLRQMGYSQFESDRLVTHSNCFNALKEFVR